ncbi:hypothetical protein [Dysgonomonas sp. 25]|uniref:hypothetical protein n=1 Tax=Dysgonomonas sp. 25 TaxID=2302933 RepID=UPI0013D6D161|nr:hypothetical protein [Dysgonomonas sp. 25]
MLKFNVKEVEDMLNGIYQRTEELPAVFLKEMAKVTAYFEKLGSVLESLAKEAKEIHKGLNNSMLEVQGKQKNDEQPSKKAMNDSQGTLEKYVEKMGKFQTTIKNQLDIIDYDKTKAALEQVNESLQKNAYLVEDYRRNIEGYYDELFSNLEKSKGQISEEEYAKEEQKISKEKADSLADYQTKYAQFTNLLNTNIKNQNNLFGDFFASLHAQMKKFNDEYMVGINGIFTAAAGLAKQKKAEAEEDLKEITEKYNKIVEERKKSTEAINALENKAANARGGRAIALQEQIDAEMAKNQGLAAQESQLAKDKEKAEKEKAKQETRAKKIELKQGLVKSVSDIAMGVAKALSMGLPGIPIAAMIGAMGAIQIATQTRQLNKLEDGGLLRGKRHTQGGMRILGSNIEVEGGEFVINRHSTRRNLGLINYINSQRRELNPEDVNSYFDSNKRRLAYKPMFAKYMEEGGQIPSLPLGNDMTNRQLLDAIQAIRIEPRVAVTDINRVQQSMVQADQWVGIQ